MAAFLASGLFATKLTAPVAAFRARSGLFSTTCFPAPAASASPEEYPAVGSPELIKCHPFQGGMREDDVAVEDGVEQCDASDAMAHGLVPSNDGTKADGRDEDDESRSPSVRVQKSEVPPHICLHASKATLKAKEHAPEERDVDANKDRSNVEPSKRHDRDDARSDDAQRVAEIDVPQYLQHLRRLHLLELLQQRLAPVPISVVLHRCIISGLPFVYFLSSLFFFPLKFT